MDSIIYGAGLVRNYADGNVVASIDINGGTIDATTIGATTPAAGAFTTLSATSITATGTGSNIVSQDDVVAWDKVKVGQSSDAEGGRLDWFDSNLYLVAVASSGFILRVNETTTVLTATSAGAAAFGGALTAADNVGLAATKKLYFDGVAMTGDTYITESSANVLDLYAGAAKALSLAATTVTLVGTAILPAATTTLAPLRIPHGTAPTSPTNGDIWTDASGLYVRIDGVTKTVAFTA